MEFRIAMTLCLQVVIRLLFVGTDDVRCSAADLPMMVDNHIVTRLVMLSPGSFDLHIQFVKVLGINAVFGSERFVKSKVRVKTLL